jgi:hypothetical protein
LVVKVFWQESLGLSGEPAAHILSQARTRFALQQMVDEELLFAYLYARSF